MNNLRGVHPISPIRLTDPIPDLEPLNLEVISRGSLA